jgi:porin
MDVGPKMLRGLFVLVLGAPLIAREARAGDEWFAVQDPWVNIEPCAFEGSCGSDLCTAPNLTGDWGGLRTGLGAHGIAYDARWTQFYQGVAHGGRELEFVYGGKVDQFINGDGETAGLWKGFFISLHAETRMGEDIDREAVGLAPSNVAMLYPLPDRNLTAITGLTFTQALSEEWLVSIGKFNLIDMFNQLYPQTGRGIDGFMNVSSFVPLSSALGTNLSINGVGITKLHAGQVQGSLSVLDTHNSSTTVGLSDLYDSGAATIGYWRIFSNFGGRPGSHALMGLYSTGTFTSVDPTNWYFVPNVGIVAGKESGTWNVAYFNEQKVWVDPANPKRNIGFLSALGVSDGNPNPFRWSGFTSLQAAGFSDRRSLDSFGIAFFYTGLSNDFVDLASPLIALEDPYGCELYYNAGLTPWFNLTADVQLVNPAEVANDTAVVLGLRGSIRL